MSPLLCRPHTLAVQYLRRDASRAHRRGAGLIGRATARRLLAAGWQVDVTGRNPAHLPPEIAAAGGAFIAAERNDSAQLLTALGDGADLLVDCICYTAAEATSLLPLVRSAGSTVMISSKAVYVDGSGSRSQLERHRVSTAQSVETQPTVTPGDGDYVPHARLRREQGRRRAGSARGDVPVTVLRPSKIHGAGAQTPREWVFVKRVLDRRPAVFLARRGASIDHPTAAANLAALIEVVAAKPSRRVLNSADPDAPSALEISRTIARQLDHVWEEVLLDDGADQTPLADIRGTRRIRSCST